MYNELATNGLPEISFNGMADTEQLGGSKDKVKMACGRLNELADGMKRFGSRLDEKKEDILSGWEGESAEEFERKFPDLLEAFAQVEPSIRSFAEWADHTMNRYSNLDESIAQWMKR
ncbi:MAG: hypothetical protein ACI4DW_08095 [Lachnospiraceae bacterium]